LLLRVRERSVRGAPLTVANANGRRRRRRIEGLGRDHLAGLLELLLEGPVLVVDAALLFLRLRGPVLLAAVDQERVFYGSGFLSWDRRSRGFADDTFGTPAALPAYARPKAARKAGLSKRRPT